MFHPISIAATTKRRTCISQFFFFFAHSHLIHMTHFEVSERIEYAPASTRGAGKQLLSSLFCSSYEEAQLFEQLREAIVVSSAVAEQQPSYS